jgi:serine O-acetyltransferase
VYDHGPAPLPPEDTYPSPGLVPLDGRGHWWAEYREDLGRYRAHHDGQIVLALLTEQGLWALLQYRLASAAYRRWGPVGIPLPMLAAMVLSQKLTEMVTGIRLPFQADLAPGLYIGHFGPTLINEDAVVGPGCNLSQGVSLGVSGRGKRRGAPRIGRRVYIGANAVVAGAVTVGDDSVIGAGSVVTRDVPPGVTVAGNPAVVVNDYGTVGMGLHQVPVRPVRPRS